MVGKWHLGNYRQVGHGFDHWVAFTKGHTTDFYDNEVYAGRSFRPFPPVDDRIIASLVTPFDFELDPAEEYTLASAFNNVWWTVLMHNDQATRANAAAQNALVDHAIGRVIDALDAEGLIEETLVIMTTDQGNPYGQRGLWGHPQWTDPPFVHDVTFNVPLVIRQPATVPAQRVVDPRTCRHQ